jgi:hypothetical protein
MSLLHDVLSFLAKCRGTHVYQATVQAFGSGVCVQTFASTGRVNGQDLQPQGSLHSLAFASKGRQKTSCLNICKTVESIMRAYHGVVGCSRGESRSGGGFTSHSGRFAAASDYENPITEPRPKRPRGSGKPRRGAHRPDRPHLTRNTSGSRRVTFASQLVHYPPDKPLQYTTPKPEPLETVLHETTEFPLGLRHQV